MADEREAYLNLLSSDEVLGFDVETNGLRWKECYTCGYGLSDGISSYYVPVRHASHNVPDVDAFEADVAHRISKRKKPLVAHNAKFDMHFSENHGIKIGNKIIDTMVMACLLDENRSSYSLKAVCRSYPDIAQKSDTEIYGHLSNLFGCPATSKSMAHYYKLPGNDAIGVEYAKADNVAVKQLWDKQYKDLYSQQLDVLQELECQLTYVLQKMERRGVKINMEAVGPLKVEAEQLQLEAYSKIPLTEDLQVINVKSSKSLQQYFSYMGIEDWPVTEKGNPSFNKLYLESMNEGEIILQARKLDHFINSFLEPLDRHIQDGRIHTSFNQTAGEFGGTKFGRLSSVGPNMQQVPKRDKFLGRRFRKIFVPDADFLFVEFDYSQAEPRLFTHYSEEPILLEGYNSTPYIDMHAIACEYMNIYGRFEDSDTGRKEARDMAKSLNLGMMYMMGSTKLANQLGITYEDAKEIVRSWYRTFKNVGSFTKDAARVAEARGHVKTILGRRARLNDPRFSYRMANRIVQGGCADILKWKMVEINRWIEQHGYDDRVQLLLNIHDSLLIQFHKDHLHLIKDVKRIMENVQAAPFNLKVPFVVEYKEPANDWSKATYGA